MPPAIPVATYRLQLTSEFTFDDAAGIVPYLKRLGISHVYTSPFMKARKGSMHGYDIVDHNTINPELGGEAGFDRFSAALKAHDLGLILDFVPNHMGVHFDDNEWWLDVLEWGQKSPFATTFDIDWDMLPFRKKPGVLLPILGSSYGEALANGQIELKYNETEGSFSAWYFEHRLPIAPERYSDILRAIVSTAGDESPVSIQLMAIAARFSGPANPVRAKAPELKNAIKMIGATDLIIRGLDHYEAGEARPAQTQALHNLLERQHYRLAHWRLATSEINYRRFFDVNSLAGIRVEDRNVFDRIHGLVYRLLAENKIQGLRLDHIDGLRDPAQYFQRLRSLIKHASPLSTNPTYILVEKILGEGEDLPRFADVAGTTGYEWLNEITRVLANQKGVESLGDIWRQASNVSPDFDPVLRNAKQRVLETLLASEFTVLTRLLARIAAGHYSTRDYSEDSLRQALEIYVLHFPVYRTYITGSKPPPPARELIASVISNARADWFSADDGIFDFLRDALTLDLIHPSQPAHSASRVQRFAYKMQQFTGPMMAKSLEDTSFYRYHKLLAFNEVGGEPAAPARTIQDFSARMVIRSRDWPHGMTSTATHDTKRGEDARARILALAEIPGEWADAVAKWKVLNSQFIVTNGDVRSPSVADEYMIYQALVGAFPLEGTNNDFVARMKAYAGKAVREAKLQTSWLNPNEFYETAVETFLNNILDEKKSESFLNSLTNFMSRISMLGALNSLSQLALKATLPGVPDFYQGTELWDFSLVDPDNRRPVNFSSRMEMLGYTSGEWSSMTEDWQTGRLKIALTHHLLTLRNQHTSIFRDGRYLPLDVSGANRDHIIAFARVLNDDAIIVVIMRHFAPFTKSGFHWPEYSSLDATIDLSEFNFEHPARWDSTLQLRHALGTIPAVIIPAKFATQARLKRTSTRRK